jgi:two-component system sensor kinase FixL
MGMTDAAPELAMPHKMTVSLVTSGARLLLAGCLALAIFLLDTLTTLDIAIAVLYVGVVLLSINFPFRHSVPLTALACAGMTVLSFFVEHAGAYEREAVGRCLVAIAAITITALLAMRIRAATERLRERADLLDLTHDSVFVRDMNGLIKYWNRGAEELYGWRRAEAVGRTFRDLVRMPLPVAREIIMEELLRTGHWEGEIVHTRRSGEVITVASRWALQRDERKRPFAILETNTDISERKRTEAIATQQQQALEQAQAELAHVSRVTTLGELAASIAHEVNQPLAAIVTNGEAAARFLDRDEPDLAEVRAAVAGMVSDARRAGEVVARLRALAKKTSPQKTNLVVNDVVSETIQLVRREVADNRVVLQVDLADGLAPVIGDRVQLQQVIINLVVNGIEAMAAITDRRRELKVRTAVDGNNVLVAMEDNGIGVESETIDRLFGPFYTTKPKGLGMGLSICRSIIEAHNGRLWASANAGPGATFQFTLPFNREPMP